MTRLGLHYCIGRSSYDGSPYNNTDIESLIEERIRSNVEASRQFRAKYRNNSRENKLAARICNWKERQKRKIINKYLSVAPVDVCCCCFLIGFWSKLTFVNRVLWRLKRKKAAVEAWEKRTTEAKNDMRKLKVVWFVKTWKLLNHSRSTPNNHPQFCYFSLCVRRCYWSTNRHKKCKG